MTGGASTGNADPFAPTSGKGNKRNDTGSKLMNFLTNAGIPFVSSKGHRFVFDGFQMIITHERNALDLIEKIIRRFDPDRSKQISFNVSVFESSIGKIDQILSELADQNDRNSMTSIIEHTEAKKIGQELLASTEFDLLHAPNIVVLEGQVAQISSGQEMVYPTNFEANSLNQSKGSHSITPQFDALGPEDERPGFRHIGLALTLLPKVQKIISSPLRFLQS